MKRIDVGLALNAMPAIVRELREGSLGGPAALGDQIAADHVAGTVHTVRAVNANYFV